MKSAASRTHTMTLLCWRRCSRDHNGTRSGDGRLAPGRHNAYARRVKAAGPNALGFFYYSGSSASRAGRSSRPFAAADAGVLIDFDHGMAGAFDPGLEHLTLALGPASRWKLEARAQHV